MMTSLPMPNEIITIPSAVHPASYVFINDQTWAQWVVGQGGYPVGGANRRFQYLTRNVAGGSNGNGARTTIFNDLKVSVRAYAVAYATAHLGGYVLAGFIVDNIMNRTPAPPAIDQFKNKTPPQTVVHLGNAINRSQIENQSEAWARSVRQEVIEYWFANVESLRAAAPALAPTDDAGVRTSANVSCGVWKHTGAAWVQIGNQYNAVPGAIGPNHAEMQWWAANAAGLAVAIGAATRVDFHISCQPCGGYCAERMIQNWGPFAGAVNAYIRTYRIPGDAFTYQLTARSIVWLG